MPESRHDYLEDYYAIDWWSSHKFEFISLLKGKSVDGDEYIKTRVTREFEKERNDFKAQFPDGGPDPYPILSLVSASGPAGLREKFVARIEGAKIHLFWNPASTTSEVSVMGLMMREMAIGDKDIKARWSDVKGRIMGITEKLSPDEKISQYAAANRFLSEIRSASAVELGDDFNLGRVPGPAPPPEPGPSPLPSEVLDPKGKIPFEEINSEDDIDTDLKLYKIRKNGHYYVRFGNRNYRIIFEKPGDMSQLKDLLEAAGTSQTKINNLTDTLKRLEISVERATDELDGKDKAIEAKDANYESLRKRLLSNLKLFQFTWIPSKTAASNPKIIATLQKVNYGSSDELEKALKSITTTFSQAVQEFEDINLEEYATQIQNGDHIGSMVDRNAFGISGSISAFVTQN